MPDSERCAGIIIIARQAEKLSDFSASLGELEAADNRELEAA